MVARELDLLSGEVDRLGEFHGDPSGGALFEDPVVERSTRVIRRFAETEERDGDALISDSTVEGGDHLGSVESVEKYDEIAEHCRQVGDIA